MVAKRLRSAKPALVSAARSAPLSLPQALLSFGDGFVQPEPALLQSPVPVSPLQARRDVLQIQRTLSFLENWRNVGKLDPLLYRALSRLCAEAGALPEAQRLHQYLTTTHYWDLARLRTLETHKFLANELVYMYGRCRSVEDARATFDRIPDPEVWSYNCMLSAYLMNGHMHPALEMFEKMPEKDMVSWNTILRAFVKFGFFQDARDLFVEMPERNVVSWNIMLTAFARNGHLGEAWIMMNEMPERSVVSYNVMIAAYARQGSFCRCLFLFRGMLFEGIFPANGTFYEVLGVCSGLQEGRFIHRLVLESDLAQSVHVMNSLLRMYQRCGSLEDCAATFSQMESRDVVSWSTMITAYSQSGDLANAEALFEKMVFRDESAMAAMTVAYSRHGHLLRARALFEATPEKQPETFSALIEAYGRGGDIVGAEALFDAMEEKDAASWSSLAAAYAATGHLPESVKALAVMDLEGFQPTPGVLVTIFQACSVSAEAFSLGKSLHRSIGEMPQQKEVETAVLKMFYKQGSFLETCLVFSKLSGRGRTAYNIVICGYVLNGFRKQAWTLFRLMSWEGIEPEGSTFVSLLAACSSPGDCREQLLSMVRDFGIEPGLEHYVCVVESLGRAGKLDDAEELIENMPFEPDATAWECLVSACKARKDHTREARAMQRLESLREIEKQSG